MKKIILITFSSLLLISCKKDWTCTCEGVITANGQTEPYPPTTSVIFKSKKSDAKTQCDNAGVSAEQGASLMGGSANIDCSLSN